jgi:hypothetical protein
LTSTHRALSTMSINIGTVKHIPKETRYTFLQVRCQATERLKSSQPLEICKMS